jgi:integrase
VTSRLKPLSARAIDSLKRSSFVGGVPGLELRISSNGTRSWRLLYRLPGSSRRRSMKLGRYPDLNLSDARKLATDKLALAGDAKDPREERRKRSRALDLTVRMAVEAYLRACQADNDVKTVADKRSALTNALIAPHGHLPLQRLDRKLALGVLDSLSDRPALRRVAYAYIRHFLGWCADRGDLPSNPLAGVRPPRSVAARERVLAPGEIRLLWKAEGVMADISRLALLTVQRRASIETMRWDNLDLRQGIWTIPGERMKSGRLHEVPLSASAIAILERQPRMSGPFLFGVGSNGHKPFGGVSKSMNAMRARLYGEHWRKTPGGVWRLHDLRRTAVSLAQQGGASIEEIRALTQHRTPGVIGVYARHAYTDEKRRVVTVIEKQIATILADVTGRH